MKTGSLCNKDSRVALILKLKYCAHLLSSFLEVKTFALRNPEVYLIETVGCAHLLKQFYRSGKMKNISTKKTRCLSKKESRVALRLKLKDCAHLLSNFLEGWEDENPSHS